MIKEMLNMNYEECCDYLKNKYGKVPGNYFLTPTCSSVNNKIKRASSDGLFIHHIDEDKAINLSIKEYAINNPFEYQLADRLVYCNLLEHLVLHIKIIEYPSPNKNANEDVGIGGIFNFIIPELNDIYSGYEYKQKHKIMCANQVVNYIDDYLYCIEYMKKKFNYPVQLYLTGLNLFLGISSVPQYKEIFEKIKEVFSR